MKTFTSLLAFILICSSSLARAQLIQTQNHGSSMTVTLTQSGPMTLLAAFTTTGTTTINPFAKITDSSGLQVETLPILSAAGQFNGNNSVNTLDATTEILSPGTYTITFGDSNPNSTLNVPCTVIAPNEPPSGATAAIASLQNSISSLQTQQQSDEDLIATLQTSQTNQASQISAFQADEAADAANIAALQNQLTTIQNTLQGEIDANTAAITALQNRTVSDESSLSQVQGEIADLQNQASDSGTAISALQQQQTATTGQLQADETTQAQQQSEITSLQNQGGDNSSAIANLQQQLVDTKSQLQTDEATLAQQQAEITALQNSQSENTADAIATLQQQQTATTAQQQTDEASLAALQNQQAATQDALSNLQTQLANDEAAQAAENVKLESEIAALQGQGTPPATDFQSQINALNKSNSFTQKLTYAGIGLGVAGLGTGIWAILNENPDGDSSNKSTNNTNPNQH